MKIGIIRKIIIIAAASSVLLCGTAYGAEENILDAILAESPQNAQGVLQDILLPTDNHGSTQGVLQDILRLEELEETREPKEQKGQGTLVKSGTVTADILNVRSGPSTHTEKLGTLSLGTALTILGEEEGWYKIVFRSETAYICGEYVEIKDSHKGGYDTSDISEYAKTFIGTPYVSGGNTPEGFDCSGFVQYVMSNFGVAMPRLSADQYSVGVKLDKSELMPGDLVFFKYSSSSDTINHVGIYLGDGSFIHSPAPGLDVKVDTLTTGYFSQYYYGATRVLE